MSLVIDLNILETEDLQNVLIDTLTILENRKVLDYEQYRKDYYSKGLYFNIDEPTIVISAFNKRNAKNILKCDIKKVRNVIGVLEEKYKENK